MNSPAGGSTAPRRTTLFVSALATLASILTLPAAGQLTNDPYPDPIPRSEGVIRVDYVEFAQVPDFEGRPPRMMHLAGEPGRDRMFVSDMWGVLYRISDGGETVTEYLDLTDSDWGFSVDARSGERGFQSFAFHPQFSEAGTQGYGKFYTYLDVIDTSPVGDFTAPSNQVTHHTLLLEWTAGNPEADAYDGERPREVMRFAQPFANHNAGQLGFNPLASPGDSDFGLLYMGVADGGSGGDPMDLSQNLGLAFGKIFRIDPLGSTGANGEYGIPSDNPFAGDGDPTTLGEIYAYGVRNPQRLGWDPANGNLFMSDIGQNTIEELSLVTRGANLGWNEWEGSYRFIGREGVDGGDYRTDPSVTYPVAEYGHTDPLLVEGDAAASGVHVYRGGAIPQLDGLVLFGDNPSGEILYIDADNLPEGGEEHVRRILLNDDGQAKTLLQLIREKNQAQGREPANNVDLRIGTGPDGQVLLLNKFDGTIRMLVP